MAEENTINNIYANFLGEPGNRKFYILFEKNNEITVLWVEKDQLISLGRACSKLLADNVKEIEKIPEKNLYSEITFPEIAGMELTILRIGVDFSVPNNRIVMIFDDQESIENGASPKVRIEIEKKLASHFVNLTRELQTSGRPTCPLCHKVLDENGKCNFCPKSNGHSKDVDIPKLL